MIGHGIDVHYENNHINTVLFLIEEIYAIMLEICC